MLKDKLPNATILDPVEGCSYCQDANGETIGYYDHEKNVLSVYEGYTHTNLLLTRLEGVRVEFVDRENKSEILYK